jgi:hypothetical protein
MLGSIWVSLELVEMGVLEGNGWRLGEEYVGDFSEFFFSVGEMASVSHVAYLVYFVN